MRRSSTSEPQPEPIFFTDRDLGRSVAAALRAGGLQIQAYHEHFTPDNVPDREWLRYVGERGWIALSHNKYIRYERDELDDLLLRPPHYAMTPSFPCASTKRGDRIRAGAPHFRRARDAEGEFWGCLSKRRIWSKNPPPWWPRARPSFPWL